MLSLTVFQGRVGDHNDLAIPAALAIGTSYALRLGLKPTVIGTPAPAMNINWQPELAAALPDLRAMSDHFETIFRDGQCPLSAISRCATALATLPVVTRHRPDAVVVWFDSHADLNTPENTTSGYLGGLALAGAAGLWESGLGSGLALSNIVLVGVRDLDPPETALIQSGKVRLVSPHPDMADDLRRAIAGRPVYVHLDCDVLNPGIVPTDYSHDGGIDLAQLHALCSLIAEHEVIGLEIAELQSAWVTGGPPVSVDPLLDALAPLIAKMQP